MIVQKAWLCWGGILTAGVAVLLVAILLPRVCAQHERTRVPFALRVIDQTAGDIKLVGDIDGDTFPDLIIGGHPNEPLSWYRYPKWEKTAIATASNEFTTDGALGDVDGDGDLDIVVPDGDGENNLLWFENPRPTGDASLGGQWKRHVVGSIGGWGKDVKLADFDGDGRLDVATRSQDGLMIFFQTAPRIWKKIPIVGVDLGHEGMAIGDIDGDGHMDLVLRGVWVRNPGGSAAQVGANWKQYRIGPTHTDFKALVVDLNGDGRLDVVFSSSEGTADVVWWTPTNGDPTGSWTPHVVVRQLERAHTLQAADIDLDGHMDLVIGQMHTSWAQEIAVYYNDDGTALKWSRQVVGRGGLHNGVVADIGNDGDYDIFGANWTGNPPVRLWENKLDELGPLTRWTYKEITAKHSQTFGLAFGDVDGDGRRDIISGRYWYRNPGGDLLAEWKQAALPAGMEACLAMDVDGDGRLDVIAQKAEGDTGIYWLKATGSSTWNAVRIGTVPQASHGLGAQGYRVAPLKAGEKPAVFISSGNGIFYFSVPSNPEAGGWPRVHVTANASDEGFAVGDIDGDGLADVAATTGDSKRVEWYRNPGDGTSNWKAHAVATVDAVYLDRTELADLNGDGRLDIIVTEENGADKGAKVLWFEHPADPTQPNWKPHLVTTQATTHSLDAVDMDGDGDIDLVVAEHRGKRRLTIFVNDGKGDFKEHQIDSSKESHLGARTVDLDADGDLDIVSIAWDDFRRVHLWRNDAPRNRAVQAQSRKKGQSRPPR